MAIDGNICVALEFPVKLSAFPWLPCSCQFWGYYPTFTFRINEEGTVYKDAKD